MLVTSEFSFIIHRGQSRLARVQLTVCFPVACLLVVRRNVSLDADSFATQRNQKFHFRPVIGRVQF